MDVLATVRTWATYSEDTVWHDLSPDCLHRVIESVKSSSDQVIVAEELAQVLQPCTCAHVVAAMDACPTLLTEIACAMVPHVQDKDNKHFVLGLLPECDQEKVATLF